MSNFFIPARGSEDWKNLLAEPVKHWRTGFSAKSLACCWQEEGTFPKSIQRIFDKAKNDRVQQLKFLMGFPEYKVHLPGGGNPSQNDIFVLAESTDSLFTIMIEGKVAEDFDKTVQEIMSNPTSPGRKRRLEFLCEVLGIPLDSVNPIRYQLLHRTASAVIEAKKFHAKNAMMLVHSFSQQYEHFDDYAAFVGLFGLKAERDAVLGPARRGNIDLFFAWCLGDAEYLKK